ncbi:MAG: hypothetical protein ACN6NU_02560 [Acinetobacter sp.]|uniref:hypothetical protein n=1 Tax=Acinetobacter sp. UBA5934 TaxID=1945946 RepID=UPI0039C8A106
MHDFLCFFIDETLLGLSVAGYLYVNSRIAGMSGLIAQVLNFNRVKNRHLFMWSVDPIC